MMTTMMTMIQFDCCAGDGESAAAELRCSACDSRRRGRFLQRGLHSQSTASRQHRPTDRLRRRKSSVHDRHSTTDCRLSARLPATRLDDRVRHDNPISSTANMSSDDKRSRPPCRYQVQTPSCWSTSKECRCLWCVAIYSWDGTSPVLQSGSISCRQLHGALLHDLPYRKPHYGLHSVCVSICLSVLYLHSQATQKRKTLERLEGWAGVPCHECSSRTNLRSKDQTLHGPSCFINQQEAQTVVSEKQQNAEYHLKHS